MTRRSLWEMTKITLQSTMREEEGGEESGRGPLSRGGGRSPSHHRGRAAERSVVVCGKGEGDRGNGKIGQGGSGEGQHWA